MKRRQRRTVAPVRILKKWAPDVGRQSDSGNKKQGNPKGRCKGARGVIGTVSTRLQKGRREEVRSTLSLEAENWSVK